MSARSWLLWTYCFGQGENTNFVVEVVGYYDESASYCHPPGLKPVGYIWLAEAFEVKLLWVAVTSYQ